MFFNVTEAIETFFNLTERIQQAYNTYQVNERTPDFMLQDKADLIQVRSKVHKDLIKSLDTNPLMVLRHPKAQEILKELTKQLDPKKDQVLAFEDWILGNLPDFLHFRNYDWGETPDDGLKWKFDIYVGETLLAQPTIKGDLKPSGEFRVFQRSLDDQPLHAYYQEHKEHILELLDGHPAELQILVSSFGKLEEQVFEHTRDEIAAAAWTAGRLFALDRTI